jgi:hypothetical protein
MAANGLRAIPQAAAPKSPTIPADLAEVIKRWQSLPSAIRAEVLKLIRSEGHLC